MSVPLRLKVIFVRLFVSLVANSSNWRTLALHFYCKMIFLNCIFFKERNKLTNKTLTWIQQIIRTFWFTEKNIQFSQRWWQITHDSLCNRVSKLTWLYAKCNTCIHNISQWSVLFWSLNGSLSTSTRVRQNLHLKPSEANISRAKTTAGVFKRGAISWSTRHCRSSLICNRIHTTCFRLSTAKQLSHCWWEAGS